MPLILIAVCALILMMMIDSRLWRIARALERLEARTHVSTPSHVGVEADTQIPLDTHASLW